MKSCKLFKLGTLKSRWFTHFHVVTLSACIFSFSACQSIKPVTSASSEVNEIEKIQYKRTDLSEEQMKIWPYMDPVTDSIPGISLIKAESYMKGKENRKVVVTIIDSGMDLEHESLSQYVWRNHDEIPGNSLDDDRNGFIDDFSGWNFLGDLYYAPMEMTRLIAKNNHRFKDLNLGDLNRNEKEKYKEYEEAVNEFNQIKQQLSKNLSRYESLDFSNLPKQAKDYYEYLKVQNDYHYNLDFDPRNDLSSNANNSMGDNNVRPKYKTEIHGTHVAGIVTAILDHFPSTKIKVMPVRNTPNGDEYDKDVAASIRYAVDNGARVINMSFGKSYSENPEVVYDAIKYASEKDVLIVHGAGNDGKNVDSNMIYPNDHRGTEFEIAGNFINVGAINRYFNEAMITGFTNYGGRNVDIFAPGDEIYSAVPGNKYEFQNGTSMAAPMVAAVAALVRSYYPELSAAQVKKIIMESGVEVSFNIWLNGEDEIIEEKPFRELCKSGRILNAYNALKMADVLNRQATDSN